MQNFMKPNKKKFLDPKTVTPRVWVRITNFGLLGPKRFIKP